MSSAKARKMEVLDIALIEAKPGRRAVNDDAVAALAQSMTAIGLRTPISVRYYEDRPAWMLHGETDDALVLVTGAHRLAAAKRLGWEKIEAVVHYQGDEIDAELWEIAENLHRAELTALERDEQIARWVELVDARVRQLDEPVKGGKQPKERGQAKAARELGVSEPDARRAVKVASLSHDAKVAAKEVGLDNNRSALLEAAEEPDPNKQVDKVREIATKKKEKKKRAKHPGVKSEQSAEKPSQRAHTVTEPCTEDDGLPFPMNPILAAWLTATDAQREYFVTSAEFRSWEDARIAPFDCELAA